MHKNCFVIVDVDNNNQIVMACNRKSYAEELIKQNDSKSNFSLVDLSINFPTNNYNIDDWRINMIEWMKNIDDKYPKPTKKNIIYTATKLDSDTTEQPLKRKRGRPKSSKNTTNTIIEQPLKRKRGRPKGSKNKK